MIRLSITSTWMGGVLLLPLAVACTEVVMPAPLPGSADARSPVEAPLEGYQTYRDLVAQLANEADDLATEARGFETQAEVYRERAFNAESEVKEGLAQNMALEGQQVEMAEAEANKAADKVVESAKAEYGRQQEFEEHLKSRREAAEEEREIVGLEEEKVEHLEADLARRNLPEAFDAVALRRAAERAELQLKEEIADLEEATTRLEMDEGQVLSDLRNRIDALQGEISSNEQKLIDAHQRKAEATTGIRTLQDQHSLAKSCGLQLHKDLTQIASYPVVLRQFPQPGDVPMTGYMLSGNLSTVLRKCRGES